MDWGPALTIRYGLKLADLRAMTLREIGVYIDFAAKASASS
jgi:hypothetical protein